MNDNKCEFCGSDLEFNDKDNRYHCPYCGACFDINETKKETIIKHSNPINKNNKSVEEESIKNQFKRLINQDDKINQENIKEDFDLLDEQLNDYKQDNQSFKHIKKRPWKIYLLILIILILVGFGIFAYMNG